MSHALFFFTFIVSVCGLDNGAAPTPPMGYSTWNKLRCHFDYKVLLEVADAMVSSGMVAAGFNSLNIDDCWPSRVRDNITQEIVPDPTKFPFGMRNFSDELFSRGIGLGIYTAHGEHTCQGYPGSLDHEVLDAKSYASWNVVFVKNDWCWHNQPNQTKHLNAFNAMRDALNATGKRMVHSIHWNYGDVPAPGCMRGIDCPLPNTANMWRIGNDIKADWDSVLRLIDANTAHAAAAGANHWNDADMLEVGNGMSANQDRAHFSMWCIMASPLVAGNDPRHMNDATRSILTNSHAIAVNQDPLGKQAVLISENTPMLFTRSERYRDVHLASCDGQTNQAWKMTDDGYLHCQGDEMCLDLHDCDITEGARVGVWECTSSPNQCDRKNDLWSFEPNKKKHNFSSAIRGTIRNKVRGACLGIRDNQTMQVGTFSCDPHDSSQTWDLPSQNHQFAPLRHVQSAKCLSVSQPGPTPMPSSQVWAKPLSSPKDSIALVLLNRGQNAMNITTNFSQIQSALNMSHVSQYQVLDLWQNASSLGIYSGEITAYVVGTSAAFYKLVPSANGER